MSTSAWGLAELSQRPDEALPLAHTSGGAGATLGRRRSWTGSRRPSVGRDRIGIDQPELLRLGPRRRQMSQEDLPELGHPLGRQIGAPRELVGEAFGIVVGAPAHL